MSFTIFFSHTNLEPILLEVQVLSLLHPDVLHNVAHPDLVLPGQGGDGPHDQALSPLGGQGLLAQTQIQSQSLVAEPQTSAATQGAEADGVAGNWSRDSL